MIIGAMPMAAPHPCATPGCRELVPRGRARCNAHERMRAARDRERRGSAHERGYTARWQRYRLTFLAQHPLCAECERAGRIVPATVVDHVVPHKGDEALFWDHANHRPLCKPCHDRRVDEGDFGRDT